MARRWLAQPNSVVTRRSVAWTEVQDTTQRPPRSAGEIVTDEDGSGAGALTDFLASKKFI